MSSDNLANEVRQFVMARIEWVPDDIPSNADLVDAAQIDGDDVFDLIEGFAERFEVELTDFRPDYHAGPEGCNPLWLIFRPLWATKSRIPIRLDDLIQSARQRRWCIKYPT